MRKGWESKGASNEAGTAICALRASCSLVPIPYSLPLPHPLRYHCVYRVSGLYPLGAAPVVRVSRFFQRFVFVLSTAIFAALGLGFVLGEFGLFGVHAGGEQDGAYRQMRVYAEVLKKIQTDYVTEPNINDVTTGALHGLLESLDADSSYLTPDRVQDLQGAARQRRGPGGDHGLKALWLRHRGQRAARFAGRARSIWPTAT